MIEVCIYGDEKLDADAIEIIEDLEKKSLSTVLENMKKLRPCAAAESFVDLAAKLDYRWNGDDKEYITNAIALMNELIQPGFYEALTAIRNEIDHLPRRTAMVVLSQ